MIFGGKVEWTGSALYFGTDPYTASVTFTFTNLNPGSTYSFRGVAVRGNNYPRWTLATIQGVNSAVPAHITGTGSPGIVTNGWAPYGNQMAPNLQAAWNSGNNTSGDVIGWDQIVPNGTSFSVICSNYHTLLASGALVPNHDGSGGTETIADTYCYAFSAIELSDVLYGPPEEIVITQQPQNTNTVQNAGFSLSVGVTGTAPQFQWYKGTPGSGTLISGATSPTYYVADAALADAGTYYVVVHNSVNTVTSTAATVNVSPDNITPFVLSAVRQPNITNIIVTWSEDMADNALDKYNYLICTDDQFVDCLSQEGTDPTDPNRLVFTNGIAQVVLGTSMPLDVNQSYIVAAYNMSDLAGNTVFDPSIVPVTIPKIFTFQQGVDSYAGTADTELEEDNPNTNHGTDDTVTTDDSGPHSQGLIRFNNIFGLGATQVPYGSIINGATLRFYIVNPGNNIAVHNMLVDWNNTATWNVMVGGVSTDGTEAEAAIVTTFDPHPTGSFVNVDVTSSVQEWANGLPNFGWVLINTATGSDGGFDWPTSENATVAQTGPC